MIRTVGCMMFWGVKPLLLQTVSKWCRVNSMEKKETDLPVLEQLPSARAVDGMQPGSDEWRQSITASKIAGIFDVSPWTTRFQTWLEMTGSIERESKKSTSLSRGSFLEDGIARWWLADRPELTMYGESTYQSNDYGWAFATPDRILRNDNGELALLEVKTAARTDGWDESTGRIPDHYWLQIAWQAFVTGVHTVHVTCLGTFLDRMDFMFDFNNEALDHIFDTVQEFRDSLGGEMPPVSDITRDIEALLAITEPEVGKQLDVSPLFDEYRELKLSARDAEQKAKSVRAEMMGYGAESEALTADGKVVAKRSGNGFRFSPIR